MIGYAAVVDVFDQGDKNKGLEGITSYPPTDRFFVLKEGEPGMLLELSGDLSTIINYKTLIQGNGFQDEGLPEKELDFSGLCYDKERDLFWIVSDKGQRVFLYDWKADQVVQSMALGYTENGIYQEIEKAEGVALDGAGDRLYVVSDAEARLYVFDVQP